MRLQDVEAATRMRELLEPVAGHTAWPPFTALWPNDLALAQLCLVLGDGAAADRYLRSAGELCERCDLPHHRVRVELHRAFAARKAARDDEADEIAAHAVPAARALSGAGVAREAALLLAVPRSPP